MNVKWIKVDFIKRRSLCHLPYINKNLIRDKNLSLWTREEQPLIVSSIYTILLAWCVSAYTVSFFFFVCMGSYQCLICILLILFVSYFSLLILLTVQFQVSSNVAFPLSTTSSNYIRTTIFKIVWNEFI